MTDRTRPADRPPLVLASASPRRRELLAALGLEVEVVPASVDESLREGESAADGAVRLASEKAEAVAAGRPGALVLAADTLVVLDGDGGPDGETVLAKPDDADDARRMLRMLSGRTHRVVTGLALCPRGAPALTDVGVTRVRFAELSEEWLEWYVATGEPMDKAGAYGVQGGAALLVAGIEGSWSNVVGLPLERLPELFRRAGDDLRQRLSRRRD